MIPHPGVSKTKELRDYQTDLVVDGWNLHMTCAGFGVRSAEVGFTYEVNKGPVGYNTSVGSSYAPPHKGTAYV